MPGLNGLELQQALIARGHELPIIFLTGHGDIPMSVRAMKRGAVDFLTKPVNDDDLLKAIHTALDRDRSQREDRAEVAGIRQRLASLTPRERGSFGARHRRPAQRAHRAELGTAEKPSKFTAPA